MITGPGRIPDLKLPHRFAGGRFRKLHFGESEQLRVYLRRLTPEDRRLRFFGHVSDAWIGRYGMDRGPLDAVILGWFAGGHLRAAGELVFEQPGGWNARCEIALSVERAFQNEGIGSELLRRLILIARNRGVASVLLLCLAENRKMRSVARRFSFEFERQGDTLVGSLSPPSPGPLSWAEEAIADGCAILGMISNCRPRFGDVSGIDCPTPGASPP